MKHLFCYSLLLISLAVEAQFESATENIFIITTDGFRWQEVFTGADEQLINDPRYCSGYCAPQTDVLGSFSRNPAGEIDAVFMGNDCPGRTIIRQPLLS